MKKFIFTNLPDKEHTSYTQKSVQIRSATDGTFLTREDIMALIEKFDQKYPGAKYTVTGLGISGLRELTDSTKKDKRVITSFKSYDSKFKWLSEEEYLNGRVLEDTKFSRYFQITLAMVIPKKFKFK